MLLSRLKLTAMLLVLGLFGAGAGSVFVATGSSAGPLQSVHDGEEANAPASDGTTSDEPAWLKKFHAAYQLDNGEYVKRVPAPFIPERRDFVRPRFPGADDSSMDFLLTMGVLFVVLLVPAAVELMRLGG